MLNCMNIGILLVYAFILFKVLKKEQKVEAPKKEKEQLEKKDPKEKK